MLYAILYKGFGYPRGSQEPIPLTHRGMTIYIDDCIYIWFQREMCVCVYPISTWICIYVCVHVRTNFLPDFINFAWKQSCWLFCHFISITISSIFKNLDKSLLSIEHQITSVGV